MTIPEGHVYIDLLQVLREQDDILANEAADEIERLRKDRNEIIEECARVVESFESQGDLVYCDEVAAAIRALKDKP